MDTVPFCERCGRPGPSLSGFHPEDDGLVRWTLYRCGHVITEVVIEDDASSAEEADITISIERAPGAVAT
jgi:hypothetical protein